MEGEIINNETSDLVNIKGLLLHLEINARRLGFVLVSGFSYSDPLLTHWLRVINKHYHYYHNNTLYPIKKVPLCFRP